MGETTILENVSIHLEAGKKYGIVGYSGSGKTSLLNFLALLIRKYEGDFLINGQPLLKDESRYFKKIAYVQQNCYVFNDTLENNITLYEPYTNNRIIDALKFAELYGIIGDKKVIKEDGKNLSGGEKQRISIARAYLRNPCVFLLDEFDSALDVSIQKKIETRLLGMQNKIVVFVTHDLQDDFLRKMDTIFYMEQGTIRESGSFEELLFRHGRFYNFYHRL